MNDPKTKSKPSGPAIFMYCVIAFTAAVAAVCFFLYYGNFIQQSVILWTGVTAFTIMYHLWMRIIMGNVSKLCKVRYNQWWFREKPFEKKLYNFLRVRKWKGKALTYNPELYNVKERTLRQIADTTAKSELDHLINILISLSTLLFALLWGELWIFLITAVLAILFDLQFVLIQRYNRPRLARMVDRERRKALIPPTAKAQTEP